MGGLSRVDSEALAQAKTYKREHANRKKQKQINIVLAFNKNRATL